MKAKRLGLSILSLFLLYQSIQLILVFIKHEQSYTWLQAIALAIMLNLFVTGVWAFLGFAFPSSKLLPENYYLHVNQKRIKRLYHFMGGSYFRQFLLHTFWKNQNQRNRYFSGGKAGLEKMHFESKQAEFGHLISFVIISLITLIFVWQNQWKVLLISQLINLFFNFYPVVLQRFLRIRVLRIKSILK
ncbi:MAG: hypothetical protein RIC95_11755 [Vicingaceae bacterium]